MLGFFSFAGECDPTSGRVDEATDEHSLWRPFTGNILRNFVVQFVGAQHVTAVPVHTALHNKNNKVRHEYSIDFRPTTIDFVRFANEY